MIIAKLAPSFAKWLRVFFFSIFRVGAFVKLSLIILILFSAFFFYNYISFGFNGEQIFLNVFFLNLILLFLITLILTKRLQIHWNHTHCSFRKLILPRYIYIAIACYVTFPIPRLSYCSGHSFRDVQKVPEKEFGTMYPFVKSWRVFLMDA